MVNAIVKFKAWECDIQFRQYGNGRPAIRLVQARTRGPYAGSSEVIAMASVNLPDEPLAEGEIFIKDYAENEGMLAALIAAGVVEDTGRRVSSGWVTIPVAKLLINPEQ